MKILELLNESVTFSLDINDVNDRYADVLSICFVAAEIFYKEAKNSKPFFYKHLEQSRFKIQFEPDGDDYNQPTGTINVYTHGAVNDHFYKDFMDLLQFTINKLKEKLEIGQIKIEGEKEDWDSPRKKFNDGDSAESIGVVRIPILRNEIEQSGNEELNVANDNARSLLRVLGLDSDELYGTIQYKDIPKMMMKIRNLSGDVVDSNIREPTSGQNTRIDKSGDTPRIAKGPMFHDMGLSSARIQKYLDKLLIILKQAQEQKVDITYG